MGKREKIIVGAMFVAILYGLVNLFFLLPAGKGPVRNENKGSELKALTGKVAEDFKNEAIKDSERYILERANTEWETDPFIGRKLLVAPPKAAEPQEIQFAYTGYIDSGRKKLAIVNGLEYEVGDELRPGGYFMMGIDTHQVLIRARGKEESITVPFQGQF